MEKINKVNIKFTFIRIGLTSWFLQTCYLRFKEDSLFLFLIGQSSFSICARVCCRDRMELCSTKDCCTTTTISNHEYHIIAISSLEHIFHRFRRDTISSEDLSEYLIPSVTITPLDPVIFSGVFHKLNKNPHALVAYLNCLPINCNMCTHLPTFITNFTIL